jgi:ATP-dependent exoDNAse (exonuclease V) alpha subunit
MTAIWQRQGRCMIAAAIQGITAQQAGADSGADQARTLAGLRWAVDTGSLRLQPSDVVFVDEAGMIDHRSYAALLEAVAEARATLVQVGDEKQLLPVEAGGLWTVIHGMAEARDQAAELRQVRRARNPEEAQAWTDLREGRVEEALRWYRDEGLLRLYDTPCGAARRHARGVVEDARPWRAGRGLQ